MGVVLRLTLCGRRRGRLIDNAYNDSNGGTMAALARVECVPLCVRRIVPSVCVCVPQFMPEYVCASVCVCLPLYLPCCTVFCRRSKCNYFISCPR